MSESVISLVNSAEGKIMLHGSENASVSDAGLSSSMGLPPSSHQESGGHHHTCRPVLSARVSAVTDV